MQRRLILLRHGEASVDADSDHVRPLTRGGERQIAQLAARLEELGWVPDRVITSSALRARSSATLLVEAFGLAPAVAFQELYTGGLGALRQALEPLDDEVASVLVVAHNPGLSTAASRLATSSVALATADAALLTATADSWQQAMDLEGGWAIDRIVVSD